MFRDYINIPFFTFMLVVVIVFAVVYVNEDHMVTFSNVMMGFVLGGQFRDWIAESFRKKYRRELEDERRQLDEKYRKMRRNKLRLL